MLQLNTLVRFIHSHSPARLSKFKKILARRPKSVPTPGLHQPQIFKLEGRKIRQKYSASQLSFRTLILHESVTSLDLFYVKRLF